VLDVITTRFDEVSTVQIHPVAFWVDPDSGVIEIGGRG
jgi:hypothetical protein